MFQGVMNRFSETLTQRMLRNFFLMETRNHSLNQARSELMKQEHQVESLNNCIDELQQQAYAQRLELEDAHHGYVESRREQVLPQEELDMTEKALSKIQIRSMHEMGEMKRAHELGVEEFSVQKLRASHKTIQRLTSQVQDLQERMNYLNDCGVFQEVESHYSGQFSHVPSQPARIPSPRSMRSCDKRLPRETWNPLGLQENFFFFANPRSTLESSQVPHQGIHPLMTPGATGEAPALISTERGRTNRKHNSNADICKKASDHKLLYSCGYRAHYRQKIVWRKNFSVADTDSWVLRVNFRYRNRFCGFHNYFSMRLQKGFVHFQNRDLREGQTRTWRRGREKERDKGRRGGGESRCQGATKHVLRRDANGRGWPGPAVAAMRDRSGSWARTISSGKNVFCFDFLSLRVSASVFPCL